MLFIFADFLKKEIHITADTYYISDDNKMISFVDNYSNVNAAFNLDQIVGFRRL